MEGGGFLNFGYSTLNQNTVTGNTSSQGGGIYEYDHPLILNQSTITGNIATNGGGGIYNEYQVFITNSIVADNTNAGVHDDIDGSFVVLGGSNIVQSINGATVTGTYITNAPLLAPLGNYGGPTQTMPPLPGSPAIDAGADFITNLFTTDQRGFPRLLGTHVDIGAVEGVYNPAGPGRLNGFIRLTNGSTKFSFTNFTDTSWNVFATTDLTLPFAQWLNLGSAVEVPIGSGQFQFTDPSATNFPRRFYRVSAP